MFWNSTAPSVEDIQNHIDELYSRAVQLDKALERAPSMNYLYVLSIGRSVSRSYTSVITSDAMWIARATYRLGAYLGTCTNDTRNVPDPIDPDKAQVVLAKVQNMVPVVIAACDKAGKARKDFDRLLVTGVVKIRASFVTYWTRSRLSHYCTQITELRWLASHQKIFADTLVGRAPGELKNEGETIAQELVGTFDV